MAPERDNFRSYKEKVIHVLQNYSRNMDYPSDLAWCLHVIKHDFLLISNSISVPTQRAGEDRRFSKTKQITSRKDDTIDHKTLDNWVNLIVVDGNPNKDLDNT